MDQVTSDQKTPQSPETVVLAEYASARAGLGVAYGPCFEKFCDQILPRLNVPVTSQRLIEDFANIDVTAEKIALNLAQNPYYEHQILKVVESVRKREDKPSIEAAVILLGMQNTRNLVLGLQALRTVNGRHAEWTKEGKLVVVPSDLLKCALKCEDVVGGGQASKSAGVYPDMAYAAGYLFDGMQLIANEVADKNGVDKKKYALFFEQQFTRAIKAAKILDEIGKTLPDFGFKKHAFAAGLLHDIGKLALAILDPLYLAFDEDCIKRELPRGVRQFAERERFGVSHSVLSGLIVGSLNVFRPIMRPILCHHDPFALRAYKAPYQLALSLRLASNMASHFKKTDKADDPVLQLWKTVELKDLRLDGERLFSITQKISV